MNITYQDVDGTTIGVITLTGRLDAANSQAFKDTFATWCETTPLFVVDCTGLDFIDSSGIGALVAGLRKAMDKGGDIHLAGVNSKVRMVLELTRANQILAMHDDTDAALRAVGGKGS